VNYYDVLKVSQRASKNEIKSAYRRLARELHPDKNEGSEETAKAFAAIAEAYEVLGSPRERARYDRKLLEHQYQNGNGSGDDSIFTSRNSHARRWRQLVYEHRYNEIINRMVAEERRQAAELQKLIFPAVALILSTFLVAFGKPHYFLNAPVIIKIVIVFLFAAGLFHIYGRIRQGLDRFTYYDDEIHDSLFEAPAEAGKPYSRLTIGALILGSVVLSFTLGLVIGNYSQFLAVTMPRIFSVTLNPEFVFYPPIFVLIADLAHSILTRLET